MLATVPVLIIRILFFSLVPIGIYLLIISIGLVRKSLNGKIVVEIPFATKSVSFTVKKAGSYAIWQKAPLFKKTPVDEFKPIVFNEATHEKVILHASLWQSSMNDGTMGRMELFTFSAAAGNYVLALAEGSSISALENVVTKVIPAKRADTGHYFIQVRENPPFYYSIVGIPLLIVSGLCIIGGFILGFLAHKIVRG